MPRFRVNLSASGRVDCRAVIDVPLSAVAAWGQLRDFGRYARHDYFHAHFEVSGGVPRAGARLRIGHRFGPFAVGRVGRIVRWREGEGYAFSDLSTAGPRRGFPHVFSYRLEAVDECRCRLHLRVGGRWTAPVPRWAARAWLWWVFSAIVVRVENDLLRFALARGQKVGATGRGTPRPVPGDAREHGSRSTATRGTETRIVR